MKHTMLTVLAALMLAALTLAALVWAPPAAHGRMPVDEPVPAGSDALPEGWLSDDVVVEPVPVDAVTDAPPLGPTRLALPPGTSADHMRGSARSPHPAQAMEEWRIDNGEPTLRIPNVEPGPNHGIANRFDPSDFFDTDGIPPRPVRIHKIHFLVSTSSSPEPEPTGPMEWHVWEDNGGHKADEKRDIVEPFTVTGGPGENVIDLDALGVDLVIDPPRLFQVGVANKESNETSPDIVLDSGLPFVGGSGDFHGSWTYYEEYCRRHDWRLLALDAGDGQGARSPVWMIWLEVEWLDPPEALTFDTLAGGDLSAGDFKGASRIAWGDYDGDGREDMLASGQTLFRNQGDGTFANVTEAAGIDDNGAGAIWGDYDNDGDLDFYQYTNNCVPCGKDDNYDDLWRNNGDGTFTNVREADYGGDPNAPVPRDPLPTEAATWADMNGDGYLDLYAANHVDWDTGACFDDYLWLNEGPPSYGFRDVSERSGIRSVRLCGRGVNAADFDGDGDTDVFVSNYRLNRDLLWVNHGKDLDLVPILKNEARERGVEGTTRLSPHTGAYGHTIGSVWGDLDRDSDQDLVAARLAHSAWLCFSDKTMVYASDDGGASFSDVREDSGVAYLETHSDPSLADIDNDGYPDLHITHVYDGWRASTYRNATGDDGDEGATGIRFEDVTHLSGIYPRTAWGSGWSDFDNDGDVDLASRGLWSNRAVEDGEHHFLQVEVVGCGRSNRDAIGAKVYVDSGEAYGSRPLEAMSEVHAARGTGSQDSRIQHFGLGSQTGAGEVSVVFPSGQTQTLANVAADQRLRVTEVGAYIRPSAWSVQAGEEVTFTADACDVPRDLRWDLDGDGVFDDGEGPVVTAVFTKPTRYQVVQVETSDGEISARSRAAIEVRPRSLFMPSLMRRFVR